ATGAILAIAPVFAQTTPTTPTPTGGSVITIIITAANAASVTFTFDISPETAAELAARLAEQKAELATPAETNVDENVDEEVEVEADNDAPAAATKTVKTVTVKLDGDHKTVSSEHEADKD
ncbi:MAG TPA: hypothetical protein VGR34_04830, partial [Candidatus Dormibacteraeota bacterium]|nr:hypothetical protein [Candidatus Dormibacteraeota bacterium]